MNSTRSKGILLLYEFFSFEISQKMVKLEKMVAFDFSSGG